MSLGRRALIDNATLTGVERITGRIKVANTYNVEGDVLCLENLIQALLFYDDVFFIDDYKKEYKDRRSSFFSFLSPLQITEEVRQTYDNRARVIMDLLSPTIQHGKLGTSDLAQLLRMIQMNVVFTWDMRSSEYYLTLKLLAENSNAELDKYGALAAMIFSGFTEQSKVETAPIATDVKILDQFGRPLVDGMGGDVRLKNGIVRKSNGVDGSVYKFLSGLSWLCFRTIFYRLVAEDSMCNLFLHPIRHSCLVTVLPSVNQEDASRYRRIVDAMVSGADLTVQEIGLTSGSTVLKGSLPIFSAWLAQKGLKPSEFIEEVLTLREEKIFRDARQQFSQLEEVQNIRGEIGFKTKANLLSTEVLKLFDDLRTKYGVKTHQGVSSSALIWAYNIYGFFHGVPSVPSPGINVPVAKSVTNQFIDLRRRKGFSAVFKSVIDDLAGVAKLGPLMDILKSEIQLMPDAGQYGPKLLPPGLHGARADWTAPMD